MWFVISGVKHVWYVGDEFCALCVMTCVQVSDDLCSICCNNVVWVNSLNSYYSSQFVCLGWLNLVNNMWFVISGVKHVWFVGDEFCALCVMTCLQVSDDLCSICCNNVVWLNSLNSYYSSQFVCLGWLNLVNNMWFVIISISYIELYRIKFSLLYVA